jgi:hypothetical protein
MASAQATLHPETAQLAICADSGATCSPPVRRSGRWPPRSGH